jgi:RNA recognition motif-containing protein
MNVITDHTFGFVTFYNADDAKKAISLANGRVWNSKKIKVEPQKGHSPGGGPPRTPGNMGRWSGT